MSRINRIGVSELIWRPLAGESGYVEALLDGAAGAGYEGVLLFNATIAPWLDKPEAFRNLLAQRGLSLVGVITAPGVDFGVVDRLSAWTGALGGEVLVLSGRCGEEGRDWDVVTKVIEHHGRISREHGVKSVFHHHTGWIAETMAQSERLLTDTDPHFLRGMLDCGHATKDFVDYKDATETGGTAGAAAAFYRRHHARIDYVEFKDWSPLTDLRTEVGRGQTDWRAVAAALSEHDYPGWIVVEQNPPASDARASSAESRRFIEELLPSSAAKR